MKPTRIPAHKVQVRVLPPILTLEVRKIDVHSDVKNENQQYLNWKVGNITLNTYTEFTAPYVLLLHCRGDTIPPLRTTLVLLVSGIHGKHRMKQSNIW